MKRKIAQSIMEYVLFIGVIALALAVMQVYGKRGLSAVLKKTADVMSEHGHGQDSLSYNDTEKQWFRAWGETPEITGENKMQSAEKTSIDSGKYRSSKVTSVETEFRGVTIGDMAEKEK